MKEKWEQLRGYRRFFMWAVPFALLLHGMTAIKVNQGRGGSFLETFLDLVDLSFFISVPAWALLGFLERKERLKIPHASADA
jgi:hypothetical protein